METASSSRPESTPPKRGPQNISKTSLSFVPYVLAALLFASRFFTFFAVFPLFLHYIRTNIKKVALAVLTNLLFVGFIFGWKNAAVFFSFVGVPALLVPYLYFEKKWSIERTFSVCLLAIFISAGLMLFGYALWSHQNSIILIKQELSNTVDQLIHLTSEQEGSKSLTGDLTAEEIKDQVITEFPSMVGIFALVSLWANFILLIRINPFYFRMKRGISLDFIRKWKAPEWLVWPTIASIAAAFFATGALNQVGTNFFRFLMVIYAFQGLSVLSSFFDRLKLRGIWRSMAYLILIWPLMPALLFLGFFDLWFDFRAKLRQS